MPGAEPCTASRPIDINGIVSVCRRTLDEFAHLRQDRRDPVTPAWRRRHIHEVLYIGDGIGHNSVRNGIFVRSVRVPRIPDIHVKGSKAGHLVICKVRTAPVDRKSTRLNSSHLVISYAVFCLKKKKNNHIAIVTSRCTSYY